MFSTSAAWMREGTRRETVLPAGYYRSNDIDVLLEKARRSICVVALGKWLAARDFKNGTLDASCPRGSSKSMEAFISVARQPVLPLRERRRSFSGR